MDGYMSKRKKIIRSVRRTNEAKEEENPVVHNKIMKKAGTHKCAYCPPWKHDNKVARVPKRGTKKPKYKDKR